MKSIVILILSIFSIVNLQSQDLTAQEIIQKADDQLRGEYSSAEIKMTIVRPDWQREMNMKSWSAGTEYSLILVTGPARDKGTAFLKREKEMWNWQPTIDRVIKMPPSMMSQSWMGSDFTNDDLVRESSTVEDYVQNIVAEEEIDGRKCWVIELMPKESVAVTWGRMKIWIDQEYFMQLKTEFYDEDEYLINTMLGKNIKEFSGRYLPSILEVVPADEEGHLTKIEYIGLDFDKKIANSFFSVQNMKRVR